MKNKVFLILSVLVFTILLVVMGGCKAAPPTAKGPIKIGGSYAMTGFLAELGIDSHRAALICLEQANYEVAGRPIEFIAEDNASEASVCLDKVRKLVETDGVCIITGPILTFGTDAQGPYLAQRNVPFLTNSCITDRCVLSENPHWPGWGHAGTLRQRTCTSGYYAFDELGYRTATTLVTDYSAGYEYQDGFNEAFVERGGEILQEQFFPIDTLDFTPFIINLVDADCLSITPIGPIIPLFTQLREQGVFDKMDVVVSTDCGSFDQALLQELGGAAVGVVGESHYHFTSDSPGNAEFVQLYQDKYGKPPPSYAGMGYISMQIILDALERAGGDTSFEALTKALAETELQTIRGVITFGPDGVGNTDSQIMRITGPATLETVAGYRSGAEIVGDQLVVTSERTD